MTPEPPVIPPAPPVTPEPPVTHTAPKIVNLLVNGSFEEGVANGDSKFTQTVRGWQTNSEFEVWGTGKGGVVAADGSNFLELDSQTLVDGVFQDVQTQPNVSYTLTFEAQQRPQASGAASVNDTVEVYWRGELVAKVQPGADWSTFTVTVTGSGGVDRLEFREPQGENTTVGPLIDNVKLMGPENVAEPPAPPVPPVPPVTPPPAPPAPVTPAPPVTPPGAAPPAPPAPPTGPVDTDIVGTPQNDQLNGTDRDDRIRALGSDDTIDGGKGNDVIDGGDGNDTVIVSNITNIEVNAQGELVITSDSGTDRLRNVESISADGQVVSVAAIMTDFPGRQLTTDPLQPPAPVVPPAPPAPEPPVPTPAPAPTPEPPVPPRAPDGGPNTGLTSSSTTEVAICFDWPLMLRAMPPRS